MYNWRSWPWNSAASGGRYAQRILPAKKRSSDSCGKKKVRRAEEKNQLRLRDSPSDYENFERRYTYATVKGVRIWPCKLSRTIVTAGSKDFLENGGWDCCGGVDSKPHSEGMRARMEESVLNHVNTGYARKTDSLLDSIFKLLGTAWLSLVYLSF